MFIQSKIYGTKRSNINPITMKLSATYSELKGLLLYKTGKDIEFEYGGNADTVLVKYMHIPCYVRIEKIDTPSMALSYKTGGDSEASGSDVMVDPCPPPTFCIGGLFRRGVQALGDKAIGAFIENFVKHPAISVNRDRTLNVDLSKISQLSKVLETADIDTIVFNEKGVSINLSIKSCHFTE